MPHCPPIALLALFLATAGIMTGCANLRPVSAGASTAEGPYAASASPAASASESSRAKSGNLSASDIENLTIGDIITTEEPNTQNLYDNSRYDFPITVNSRVEGWIDYFTGRGRQHMERYLARSSRYIPMMKETLKKAGLPQDLVYLALIESGFNLRAKSRARAVGPWQFMKATGKRYGLRVDAWIDERRDPIRSTEAAAQYLKDLYLMFESWYLAASAYNAGEYKILRAIEELKTNNYWRICETRAIRRETKDYVPKLIAAAIIARNPTKYGFDSIDYHDPLEFESVTVDFPVHLRDVAKLVDAPLDDLEELNPHLVRSMVPPNVGSYELRVPSGSRTLVERAIASLRGELKTDDLPYQHTIRSGETLRSIARKYRVSVNTLANHNNLSPKEKLTPGLTLIIPGRGHAQFVATSKSDAGASKRPAVASRQNADESAPAGYITHIVKSGESLWSISEMYDVTVQQLFRWNNLRRSRIHPGKRLKIKVKPGEGGESATTDNRSSRVGKARTRPAAHKQSSRKSGKKRADRRVAEKRRG